MSCRPMRNPAQRRWTAFLRMTPQVLALTHTHAHKYICMYVYMIYTIEKTDAYRSCFQRGKIIILFMKPKKILDIDVFIFAIT